jgi:hypothetical protein
LHRCVGRHPHFGNMSTDLVGRARCLRRELLYFGGYDSEALAGVTGASRLDRGNCSPPFGISQGA